MVRNYKKKSDRATKYTQAQLKNAVADIQRGALSVYQAHKTYNIPKTTLFYHVTGARGQKSTNQGRPPAIPIEDEKRLAQGLKTMEQCGFGLSRTEVLNIVCDFVTTNKIKTPFKNNMPEDEFFSAFKRRHSLSIKKPQAVECSRKKMTDPFVIDEYFTILKNILSDMKIENKPKLLWNLDETSFSNDPKKTKVVGAVGKPSSRTTSGPGRENTTVLSAVSASGLKVPPLIIFKGKHVWDSWLPDQNHSFPGTAYAASPNGWMETEIFQNYFEKTFIPALGQDRPVLLVYDGHSTHINISLIEVARANGVTIVKLPPHTSHLLQPLDLSVFKSVKDSWDQKLVTWQRHNAGKKIPKKVFSELIGSTWNDINPEIIKNGFRKAGIYPFNRNVIPDEKYHPESLKRWKATQQEIILTHETVVVQDTIVDIGDGGANKNVEICSASTTTEVNNRIKRTVIDTENPPHILSDAGPSSSSLSFEELLLNTMKQTNQDTCSAKKKKKRVAAGAEVITSDEVLNRLAKLYEENKIKKQRKLEAAERKRNKTTKKNTFRV